MCWRVCSSEGLLQLVAIFIVSAVAIWLADDENRPEMSRLVFGAMLPLLGTWVGTVLAFYFARENFQAATDSTARLTGQLTRETVVSEAMISKDQIVSHDLAAGEAAATVRLADLHTKVTSSGKHRMPILRSTGAVEYVVHRSTIAQFALSLGLNPSSAQFVQTIADLLAIPESKREIEALAFVGPNALIGTARAAMSEVEGCKDVFVTSAGGRDDAVVGWLTNTDLAKVT